VAGADETRAGHYADFGLALGLAFQIQDDVLGIWGDEAVTGKSAATDIVTRKKTLPVLYALARSDELRALYRNGASDNSFVPRSVALVEHTGARHYAAEQAATYTERAVAALAAAQPAEPAATALRQLTDRLLGRDY
jgi:geranylgeranyl diphosphate synthase type I